MYRPLPPEVTIKKSPIEGVGLVATCEIQKNTELGSITKGLKQWQYPSTLSMNTPSFKWQGYCSWFGNNTCSV